MGSKKDKLGQAARQRLDESMGKPEEKPARSNMEDFVRDMKNTEPPKSAEAPNPAPPLPPAEKAEAVPEQMKRVSREEPSAETGRRYPGMEMKKSRRDSIYNISSDIRLEDYTDGGSGSSSGGGIGGKARIIAGVALVGLLGTGIYYFAGWIFGPSYVLAVAQEDINAENAEEISKRDASLIAGEPVHIRFQWEEEGLKATYLRIKVDRVEGTSAEEQAVLGQKPPRTANYIYFRGPLDPGDYHVEVQDESGSVLRDKDFKIR